MKRLAAFLSPVLRLAGALAMISLAPVSLAADEVAGESCQAPERVLTVDDQLNHARERLARGEGLSIVVVNTASPNPERANLGYPTRLEFFLRQRLPGRAISVAVRSLPGATAREMLPDLTRVLETLHPTLLIWQAGTVDAMRGVGPDVFGEALVTGIENAHQANADIIVMDMQYSLQTTQLINFQPYVDYAAWVTQVNGIFTFPRYDLMRYWSEEGRVNFAVDSQDKKVAAFTFVHGCIARLLADSIVAMLGSDKGGAR